MDRRNVRRIILIKFNFALNDLRLLSTYAATTPPPPPPPLARAVAASNSIPAESPSHIWSPRPEQAAAAAAAAAATFRRGLLLLLPLLLLLHRGDGRWQKKLKLLPSHYTVVGLLLLLLHW
jgi:hypothetical protein